MKNVRSLLGFGAAICLTAGVSIAEDATIPETPAGYVRTGESEACLRTRNIDQMKIINTEQILVKMTNGDTWLQQPKSCSKLRSYYTLVYSSFGGELCNTTGVTLHSASADFGFSGVCIFDDFKKLEKQTAAAD